MNLKFYTTLFTALLLGGPVNAANYTQSANKFQETVDQLQEFAIKSNKSTADRAQYVKELYYSVNGYPAGTDTSMKAQPHLEQFNLILGETGIGGILYSAGYQTCESIPTSGSTSGSVQGVGALTLTFGSPTKTIPSYYTTDAGKTMDRNITVSGGVTLTIELKCHDDTAIQTGFVRLDFTQYSIVYEGYFQQNSTTNAVNVDMYIKTQGGGGTNLLIPTQFSTADGENFSIYSGYVNLDSSGPSNYLVAVKGQTNGNAQLAYLSTPDTSGSAATTAPNNFGSLSSSGSTTVAVECIDIANETITTGCSSIPAPGSLSVGGTTSTWTISSLRSISL